MTAQTPLTDPQLAGTWTLDPQRSSVRFTSKTLWGLVPVNGRFTDVSGAGQLTSDGRLSGRLVIRADSVRTGIGMRDHHLQAADFFDAERFPEIVVELTGTAPDGELAADRRARRDRPHSLGRQRQHARHDAARHHSGGRGRLRPLTRPGVVASAACPDRCIC